MHKYIKHEKKIRDPSTNTMRCCYHRENDTKKEKYICKNINGTRKYVKLSTKKHSGGDEPNSVKSDKARAILGYDKDEKAKRVLGIMPNARNSEYSLKYLLSKNGFSN
jgi:hypothetical protein